jgi:MtN3 and saliva related transmembrane protein
MPWSTILGVLASIASMTSFVPQAVRIARTRETGDLSPYAYALTVTGFALWVGYGVVLREWPIIVTNTVCGLLATYILGMIVRDRLSGASRPGSTGGSRRSAGTAPSS